MDIKRFVQKLLTSKKTTPPFRAVPDNTGLNFVLPEDVFQQCAKGGDGIDDIVQYQFITLQMLLESGDANRLPNGFSLSSEITTGLSDDDRTILELPKPWPGRFLVQFDGQTQHPSFSCSLILIEPNGNKILPTQYNLKGPFLHLTENEKYLPSPEQWHLLTAVQRHNALPAGKRGEYENLLAIHSMQQAIKDGCAADLGHFRDIEAIEPDTIGVDVQITREGDALLTPTLGHGIHTHELEHRLGQLDKNGQIQSLRVGKSGSSLFHMDFKISVTGLAIR